MLSSGDSCACETSDGVSLNLLLTVSSFVFGEEGEEASSDDAGSDADKAELASLLAASELELLASEAAVAAWPSAALTAFFAIPEASAADGVYGIDNA